MKRQIKKIAFVGIVVVLLAAAWLILEYVIPDDSADETIKIVEADPTDYSFVSVRGPESDYTFHIGKIEPVEGAENGEAAEPLYYFYDGGIYDDESRFGYYEQYSLAKAFERTTALDALELVSEAPEDYSEYGLDKEHATVVMVTPYDDSDAESFTLLIGSHNKIISGEGYYCQLAGKPEVYLISTLNAGTFLNGAAHFLTTNILPSFGEYYDEIRSLTFTNRAGDSVVIKRFESLTSDVEGELLYTSFYMESPYSCYVSDQILGEQMLSLIVDSQVVQVAVMDPSEEELETYGFNRAARIDFSLASGDFTYYFATPSGANSGVVYIMVEGYDVIYMAYGTGTFVDLKAIDFRSGLAWIHNITLVEQLDITTPSGKYTVYIDDTVDNTNSTGTWVAQILDHSTGVQSILSEKNGRSLYTDCIGTTYDELMVSEENPIIEDEPSYTMTVKYKNSSFTSTVRFYKVTSRQYAVLFDDADISEAGFTVNVVKLKEIDQDIQTILAGGVLS